MKLDLRLAIFLLLLSTGGLLLGAISGSYTHGEQLYLNGPVVTETPPTPLIVLVKQIGSGYPVGIFVTNGNPNSVISANLGALALDQTGGIWVKTSGANPSNTGWTAH